MRPISACSVAVVVAAAVVVGVALATVVAVQKNKYFKIESCIKGQLISKCLFGVYYIVSQKIKEIFVSISAVASKKDVISKKLGHFITLIAWFYFDYLTLLY